MTSSTWSFDSEHRLAACGLDVERVSRFRDMASDEAPMPMVFSAEEAARCRASDDPARAFCVCFCAKEAVLKALRSPYELTDCRVRPGPGATGATVELAGALAREHGVMTRGRLECTAVGGDGLLVAAYLFSAGGPA
jgi:phosphopantetheinyl transferase (holo-ACP synthase)